MTMKLARAVSIRTIHPTHNAGSGADPVSASSDQTFTCLILWRNIPVPLYGDGALFSPLVVGIAPSLQPIEPTRPALGWVLMLWKRRWVFSSITLQHDAIMC